MTFDEWWAVQSKPLSGTTKEKVKSAWEAAWDQQQRVIDEMHLMFKDHVLVPKEPTDEMIEAGLMFHSQFSSSVPHVYKAMIQAAQEEE